MSFVGSKRREAVIGSHEVLNGAMAPGYSRYLMLWLAVSSSKVEWRTAEGKLVWLSQGILQCFLESSAVSTMSTAYKLEAT